MYVGLRMVLVGRSNDLDEFKPVEGLSVIR